MFIMNGLGSLECRLGRRLPMPQNQTKSKVVSLSTGEKKISSRKAATTRLKMGAIIRTYRQRAGLSTKELADMLETTDGSIRHWETDMNYPPMDQLKNLCEALSIPVEELFGLKPEMVLDANETHVINFYRQSSDVGKRIIENNAQSVYESEQEAHDLDLKYHCDIIPLQATPAAAGTGCEFVDARPDYQFIRISERSQNADTLIRVSGRSMEPRYHDGDLVFVKYTESAEDGDDVICSTADGAVIKHKIGNKLYSLNRDLPYGEKHEDDHVRIIGKVLGIVGKDDLPAEEDYDKLEGFLANKIRKFKKEYW